MKRPWTIALVGVLVSFLITIALIRYFLIPGQSKSLGGVKPKKPEKEVDEKIVIEEAVPVEPDQLTVVEGIGPVSAAALQQAGIMTYAQLAATDTAAIKSILVRANVRVAVSDTWSEQAALAAAEDWDGLEKLKAELRAGRK